MRDTWIDEHTGDETVARPDFKAELRAELAKELVAPTRRQAPPTRTAWRAIGWASVAAAAAVVGVVVLNGDDEGRTVGPGATTAPSAPITAVATVEPFNLRDELVDVVWLVTTIDGMEVMVDAPPSFTLEGAGQIVGFDGCNYYGYDRGAEQGGWSIEGDVIRLNQQFISTAMECTGATTAWPVVDGTRVEFAPETGALTLFNPDGTAYTAQPSTAEVQPPLVNWSTATVLGLPLGFSSVDKALTGINPALGEPTADSGWFVVEPLAPGDEDCLAGQELRVLHWGDLTVAFKKGVTPEGLDGEQMWSWVVGDLRASGFSSFLEPVLAPTAPPTGLLTEDRFGLGTTVDELRASGEVVLSDFTNDDGTRNGFFSPTDGAESGLYQGIVVDADGTVIGFGATQSFC